MSQPEEKPLVVVKLVGGLANQMFPYAAGRRLAHVLGAELKLDVSGFSDYESLGEVDFRRYALGVFNIREAFATAEDVRALTWREPGILDKLLQRKPRRPRSHVKERFFQFDPEILTLRGSVYLQGNWNSEKYFADIADLIRQDFTFKQPPKGRNLELLNEISAVESVSIHVRRGDYVSNPRASRIHGTCDLAYYQSSIKLIASRVEHPHFFVFSDDARWARENLKIAWPCTFVDHNGPLDGHEDMRLMSSCKHNIIANSGFSWWAAWLNLNEGKIVCSPSKWFMVDKYDTSTLIPQGWLRI